MNARTRHLAAQSVSVDGALPSVKHLRVVVLLGLDAPLVLQFCQFGCPLLVHDFLKFPAHRAIAFAHLTKHVGLVHLLCKACLYHLLFVCSVLALDLCLHVLAFVLFHPFLFSLLLFLELDMLFSVLVDVAKQVNAGLVLAIPLLLSVLPLLRILVSN